MPRDRRSEPARPQAAGRRRRPAWEESAPPPGWQRAPGEERAPHEPSDAHGGRSTRTAGRSKGETAAAAAAGTSRAARAIAARVKRAADADGADESGMSSLLGAQALHSAGDAMVLVALASTVFFDVPLGEARGRVALYLVLTLLPFGLLVPIAGPLLDRFPHGRRWVLALTALLRALVAWQLATSLDGLDLFPLALAVLVLSRAYGVARSAALPRVRPPGLTLVAANARMNVAAVVSSGLGAAVGGTISAVAGPEWVLRAAAVVLITAGLVAARLPAQIDEDHRRDRVRAPRFRLLEGPPHVIQPLVSAVALRALGGFMTIFLAFLLRAEDASNQVIGIVVGSVVGGQLLGTGLASRLSAPATRRLTTASLGLPVAGCAAAAVLGGAEWAALAAGTTGVSYALSKFSLDASLQSNVPTASTSGAFSRSETAMQLSFALGGAVAVSLPAVGAVGFTAGALIPVAGVVVGQRAKRGLSVLPPLSFLPTRRRFTSGAGVMAAPQDEPEPPTSREDVEPRPPSGPDRPWWLD